MTPVVKKLNLSPGGLERWKKGAIPTGEVLMKFAQYFGVSTDYLLGLTDNESPANLNNISNSTVLSNLSNISNVLNNSSNENLTKMDANLLELYHKLDIVGQSKAVLYINNLLEEKNKCKDMLQ